MRASIVVAALILLGACRGEPVPRDYQNAPPALTHPPDTRTDTPSAGATGQAPPQPTSGVEGTSATYEPMNPTAPTTTMPDAAPVTTTT